MTLTERFARLFTGYDRAFGQYTVTGKETADSDKNVGPRRTVVEPLTIAHYDTHLKGNGPGLGVIMLQADDTVLFAAADVDNYRLDLNALEERVVARKLPLTVCRTKSGGAHLYLFLKEPVPAELVRTKLAEWVSALNLSNRTEIFPKQSTRASENDIGSWINIPYQNADGPTMRYAIHKGEALDLEPFVTLAERRRVTRAQLEAIQVITVIHDDQDPLFEAPPCLVTLHQQGGLPSGSRNDGMMAVGVYLKKRWPDEWEAKFAQYNEMFCKPPLEVQEVEELARSLRKKDYYYRCKQAPIASVCQQRACAKRQFGVGGGGDDETGGVQVESLSVNGLTQYAYPGEHSEALWALEIAGTRIMVPTSVLLDPKHLIEQLVSTGRVLPKGLVKLSAPKWQMYLSPLIGAADRLDLSVYTGAPSPLWESVIEILKSARRARNERDFLEDHGTLVHEHDGGVVFTFSMLRRMLGYQGGKKTTDAGLAVTLEAYGAVKHKVDHLECWFIKQPGLVSDVMPITGEDTF